MARNTLIVALLAGLFVLPVQAGKLYKWVDQYGNVSYQDRPPPEGVGKVEERNLRNSGASSGDPAAAEAAAKAPVVLYSVPKCAQCELARAYLRKRGVPFSDVDVSEKNPEAQQEMKKKVGELAVPTLSVGGKIMKGYMESLLEGELDQAGYPKAGSKAENAEPTEGAAAQ
jgi:glutaredoxin